MPLFAVVAFLVFVRIVEALNRWLVLSGRVDETTAFYGLTVAGARALLETTVTLNMSFLVFTFGSLLIAIQVAGGRSTPRIISTALLRDNAIRFSVGYFVFTLLCAVRVLIRMDDVIVHQFNVFLVALLGVGLNRGVPLFDRPRRTNVASDQPRAAGGRGRDRGH